MTNPLTSERKEVLDEIADKARTSRRLNPMRMNEIILQLCLTQWLTGSDLAEILQRDMDHVRDRLLQPLVMHGRPEFLYANKPNHPDQCY